MDKNPSLPERFVDRNLPVRPLPEKNTDVWIGGWPEIPSLKMAWHSRARLNMLLHCYRTPHIETGGALFGRVYQIEGKTTESGLPITVIEIEQAVHGQITEANAVRVNISAQAWIEIFQIADRDYPDLQVLGWYHSHPGHGIFLSSTDQNTHNQVFSGAHQVAVVVETHMRRYGVFAGGSKYGGFYQSELFEWDDELIKHLQLLASSQIDMGEQLIIPEKELQPIPQEAISLVDDEDIRPSVHPKKSFWKKYYPYLLMLFAIPILGLVAWLLDIQLIERNLFGKILLGGTFAVGVACIESISIIIFLIKIIMDYSSRRQD
jgi:proteasome lid subunit RPN8/RPN11